MSTQYPNRRPGGTYPPPGPGLTESLILSLARVAWALASTLTLAAGGFAARHYLAAPWWVLVAVGLGALWVLTIKPQAKHAHSVYLRATLPTKLRQAGIVNHVSETPSIYKIKHFTGGQKIVLSTMGAHPATLFEKHLDALRGSLGAVDVEVTEGIGVVTLTVVRRSAHANVRVNTWE